MVVLIIFMPPPLGLDAHETKEQLRNHSATKSNLSYKIQTLAVYKTHHSRNKMAPKSMSCFLIFLFLCKIYGLAAEYINLLLRSRFNNISGQFPFFRCAYAKCLYGQLFKVEASANVD